LVFDHLGFGDPRRIEGLYINFKTMYFATRIFLFFESLTLPTNTIVTNLF